MHISIKLFTALLFIGFLSACSDEDEKEINDITAFGPPSFTLNPSTVTTPFFTAGETNPPDVTWSGNDIGTFSMSTTATAITAINPITGVVFWDRNLALGPTTVEITAKNAGGEASRTLTIINEFAPAVFEGFYNRNPSISAGTGDNPFVWTFNADGTCTDQDNSRTPAVIYQGTWTRSGNTLNGVMIDHENNNTPFTIEATLSYDGNIARLEGQWVFGSDQLVTPASGSVSLRFIE